MAQNRAKEKGDDYGVEGPGATSGLIRPGRYARACWSIDADHHV
jgi:hypothetical protein